MLKGSGEPLVQAGREDGQVQDERRQPRRRRRRLRRGRHAPVRDVHGRVRAAQALGSARDRRVQPLPEAGVAPDRGVRPGEGGRRRPAPDDPASHHQAGDRRPGADAVQHGHRRDDGVPERAGLQGRRARGSADPGEAAGAVRPPLRRRGLGATGATRVPGEGVVADLRRGVDPGGDGDGGRAGGRQGAWDRRGGARGGRGGRARGGAGAAERRQVPGGARDREVHLQAGADHRLRDQARVGGPCPARAPGRRVGPHRGRSSRAPWIAVVLRDDGRPGGQVRRGERQPVGNRGVIARRHEVPVIAGWRILRGGRGAHDVAVRTDHQVRRHRARQRRLAGVHVLHHRRHQGNPQRQHVRPLGRGWRVRVGGPPRHPDVLGRRRPGERGAHQQRVRVQRIGPFEEALEDGHHRVALADRLLHQRRQPGADVDWARLVHQRGRQPRAGPGQHHRTHRRRERHRQLAGGGALRVAKEHHPRRIEGDRRRHAANGRNPRRRDAQPLQRVGGVLQEIVARRARVQGVEHQIVRLLGRATTPRTVLDGVERQHRHRRIGGRQPFGQSLAHRRP